MLACYTSDTFRTNVHLRKPHNYCLSYVAPVVGEFWMVYIKLSGMFFVSSAHDLRCIFKSPAALDGQEILETRSLESHPRHSALSHLVRDIFCERAAEIQINYSRMPAGRVEKIEKKILSLPDKEKYRAHKTYTLDKQVLADWEESA